MAVVPHAAASRPLTRLRQNRRWSVLVLATVINRCNNWEKASSITPLTFTGKFRGSAAATRERSVLGASGKENVHALENDGFVRCRPFLSKDAKRLHNILWDYYPDRYNVSLNDPGTWTLSDGTGVRPYFSSPDQLMESTSWKAMQRRINEEMDGMFGEGQWRCKPAATLLVNCPSQGINWTTPFRWHTDESLLPFVKHPNHFYAFVILEDLQPRGGGTMIVSGSVRRALLCNRSFGAGYGSLKDELASEHAWFNKLFFREAETDSAERRATRYASQEMCSAGVSMKVVELTGSAGDIIIWDPRALHSGSDNVNALPRTSLRLALERVKPQ